MNNGESAHEGADIEKRAAIRHQSETLIFCSFLNSSGGCQPIDGKLKNFCADGLCIELRSQLKTGTVLVVRIKGGLGVNFAEDELRSIAIAEVKWSAPIPTDGEGYYATGLRYMVL
jgi:hypothetical protein